MQKLESVLVIGTATGCVYALVGVGLVLIFRATGVLSFAQASYMSIGALLFGSIIRAGGGTFPALMIASLAMGVLSAGIYRLVMRRLVGDSAFLGSVCSVGVAALLAAVGALIWGSSTILIPSQFSYNHINLVGGLTLNYVQLFTFGTTAVVFVVLLVVLKGTQLGLRMRAVASSPQLASQVGVSVDRVSMYAWGLGGLTGGAAGVVSVVTSPSDPGTIFALALAAFPAIILGGLDSVLGALVGGLAIGILQSAIAQYWDASWQIMATYGILMLALFVRPTGLFGRAQVVRV